ncbi:MAG: TonB-dependent receptor [bacterium]
MKKICKFLRILCLTMIVVAAAYTAHADQTAQGTEQQEPQEQAVKHLTLDEITVIDEAVTEPVTVVGERTIEKGKNTTIPDVLKNEPEIDLNRRSLVGDTSDTLKIRGLSGNRIMLNIDGRSINAAGVQGGYFIDWSTIPLDNIEKIEVMKGGSSVRYGNNAGGGVINVVTRKPAEKPAVSFYSHYGAGEDISYIQNYRVTHSFKIGPFGYSLGGSCQKADEFLWNNDYEAKNLSGKLFVDMPLMAEMSIGVQYIDVERGFQILNRLSSNPDDPKFKIKINRDYPLSNGEGFSPGAGKVSTPGPGSYWKKTKYLLDFAYKQPVKNAMIELKAFKNHEERDEKNYSASWINSKYSDGKLVLDRTVRPDRSYGGSGEFTLPLKNHEIIWGIEGKVIATAGQDVHFVDYKYGTRGPVTNSDGQASHLWGYYLQDSWGITDRFLLTPGVRYDTFEAKESGLASHETLKDEGISPSVTGTVKIAENDTLTASIYRKYLTPSAPDAYWWYEGYLGGLYTNALDLEKNDAVELTYNHDFSRQAYARLSLYKYMINDYIKRYSVPDGRRGCYNIDKVNLTGGSIDGAAEIMSWMTLRGNVTYQKSKKEGDIMDTAKLTDELEYMPEWKGTTGFEVKFPFPWKEGTFSTNIRYVGEQETIDTNKIRKLDSYTTTDIEVKFPVTKYGEIGIYTENLFNERYEERFGYPMPGRIIGATAKVGF